MGKDESASIESVPKKPRLNGTEATSGRWKWMTVVAIVVVVVLVLVVVWMYRRLKQVETKLHHMDRAVEQTLQRHDQALTAKMEQFEKSSSDHRQFMQIKVDELTRTVQEHMNYLRSTMTIHTQTAIQPNPPSLPNNPPSLPNNPASPASSFASSSSDSVPLSSSSTSYSLPVPSEPKEEDLDAELADELDELTSLSSSSSHFFSSLPSSTTIPTVFSVEVIPLADLNPTPSSNQGMTIEVVDDDADTSPSSSESTISLPSPPASVATSVVEEESNSSVQPAFFDVE